MISTDKITEIFCLVDDFCKEFDKTKRGHLLKKDLSKRPYNRPNRMSDSEIITIVIVFHLKSFRNLKHFYLYYVQKHLVKEFPETVSYNRFLELQQKAVLPMALYLKTCCLGECTGISFIDSTTLSVCNNRRIHNHKVFEGIAERGHSSMGYFYGFKLHIIVNDKGELISFVITQGNVDDRIPLRNERFIKKLYGKLFGDKGYISQELFNMLFVNDISLFAKPRRNMKGKIMSTTDAILMRKRSVIESINDELKNICQIEHTRHRSFTNFIINIISGLIAYSFLPKKPAIRYDHINDGQLALYY